jgi:tRNA threonylcarbamoyladenosine biosynthesis protein TsaE
MSAHSARGKTAASDRGLPGRLERLEGPRRTIVVTTEAPDATLAIGRSIGELLPRGAVVSLEGSLGAGKTLVAKGICAGLGVPDEVLSPSFILAEEYQGVYPVMHFDLYRLDDVDEIARIGLFDAMDGRSVVLVEWADRLPPGALEADVRIVMAFTGELSRTLTIEGPGGFMDALEGSAP